MSRKKFTKNEKKISPLGLKIKELLKKEGINQKMLAINLGISDSYLTEIKKGRSKGQGDKFWKGVKKAYPEWEAYFRDIRKIPPEDSKSPPESQNSEEHIPEYLPESENEPGKISRDSDRGSFGTPDISEHEVTKLFIPEKKMSHKDLINFFKNKDRAMEINLWLLEIEKLDSDALNDFLPYLKGVHDTLKRLKKNKEDT